MCTHQHTTIVVLEAFAMFEKIGYKCTQCEEIIEITNQ